MRCFSRKVFSILVLLCACVSSRCWAGAAVAKSRQMQAQQQKIIQQRLMERQQKQLQQRQTGNSLSSQSSLPPSNSGSYQEIHIGELWNRLANSSEAWGLIADQRIKELTVAKYIDLYRQRGIKILKPPAHYAAMIDEVAKEGSDFMKHPFYELLRIVAVMEYDFDNGVDKDQLARRLLGESFYQANLKRLGR